MGLVSAKSALFTTLYDVAVIILLTLAYAVGLVVTFIALAFMKVAQPALLYLVPATLGSVIVVSLLRREFRLFFTGKSPDAKVYITTVDLEMFVKKVLYNKL